MARVSPLSDPDYYVISARIYTKPDRQEMTGILKTPGSPIVLFDQYRDGWMFEHRRFPQFYGWLEDIDKYEPTPQHFRPQAFLEAKVADEYMFYQGMSEAMSYMSDTGVDFTVFLDGMDSSETEKRSVVGVSINGNIRLDPWFKLRARI